MLVHAFLVGYELYVPKQTGALKVTRYLLGKRGREMFALRRRVSKVLLVEDVRLIQPLVRNFDVWEKRYVGFEHMALQTRVVLRASRLFEWQDGDRSI